jgi:hypothetical protein
VCSVPASAALERVEQCLKDSSIDFTTDSNSFKVSPCGASNAHTRDVPLLIDCLCDWLADAVSSHRYRPSFTTPTSPHAFKFASTASRIGPCVYLLVSISA